MQNLGPHQTYWIGICILTSLPVIHVHSGVWQALIPRVVLPQCWSASAWCIRALNPRLMQMTSGKELCDILYGCQEVSVYATCHPLSWTFLLLFPVCLYFGSLSVIWDLHFDLLCWFVPIPGSLQAFPDSSPARSCLQLPPTGWSFHALLSDLHPARFPQLSTWKLYRYHLNRIHINCSLFPLPLFLFLLGINGIYQVINSGSILNISLSKPTYVHKPPSTASFIVEPPFLYPLPLFQLRPPLPFKMYYEFLNRSFHLPIITLPALPLPLPLLQLPPTKHTKNFISIKNCLNHGFLSSSDVS